MAFTLPIFNLTCNIWHGQASFNPPVPFVPPGGPPDVALVTCQLYIYSRPFTGPTAQDFQEGAEATTYPYFSVLRVPAHTDVRAPWGRVAAPGLRDAVEVPAGSGRFYLVCAVEDCHKGFANEYRVAALEQYGYTGPFPIV